MVCLVDCGEVRTADFNYDLPRDLIAQKPAPARDQSRLCVLDRQTGEIAHRQFPDLLEYLKPGDVLVLNDSRVIPARLRAVNPKTGGHFELLLIEEVAANQWWAMMKPGKRARVGTRIQLLDLQKEPTTIAAEVEAVNDEGHRRVRFETSGNILDQLDRLGEVPVPPYIERAEPQAEDRERYQTVYAHGPGSVAAPTAGLHFTNELLEKIRGRGVKICFVTLHVGLGTFAPVKAERLEEHRMHQERFNITSETAEIINQASRVVAVGTTTLRVLESVAQQNNGAIVAGSGKTQIFIYPPFDFKIVDALVTNFHLPCSTLLMLVSAFAAPNEMRGREMVLKTYEEAVRERYRFFSYGDAMFIK
jgi:S-adenosylmethionine:tRNA ribosyltransferase-isomerase